MMKSNYKFSIASENATYEGYTSEKLLTSFMAHTVPIYWGNPYAAEEYNPEAFIRCNDYSDFDDVVRRVREIDTNDELWAHIVSQPWQTEEQRRASQKRYESCREFIAHIFTQPLKAAKRRPAGTWPQIYERNFFEHVTSMRNLTRKICRDIGIIIRLSRLRKTDIDDFFNEQGE